MRKPLELINKRFGRILITKRVGTDKWNQSIWLGQCDCGNSKIFIGNNLVKGRSNSCGCLRKELITTHGMSHTKFYTTWEGIINRCTNPRSKWFNDYGGRNILVCGSWLKFENFMKDMYESYLSHIKEFGENNTSIDRIDVDGNYEPNNCKWSTNREQQRNKRDSAKTFNYDLHLKNKNKLASFLTLCVRRIRNYPSFEIKFAIDVIGFRKYIESQFESWMNWDNYGSGKGKWNLGHKVPVFKFDLSDPDDCKRCYHYTNFKPQKWEENIRWKN